MSIFTLILGLIMGFGLKFGFDEYHFFLERQKQTAEKMEDVLTKFKAIELLKEN